MILLEKECWVGVEREREREMVANIRLTSKLLKMFFIYFKAFAQATLF